MHRARGLQVCLVVRNHRLSAWPRGLHAAVNVLLVDDARPQSLGVASQVETADESLGHAVVRGAPRRARSPSTANGPAPLNVSVARQAR